LRIAQVGEATPITGHVFVYCTRTLNVETKCFKSVTSVNRVYMRTDLVKLKQWSEDTKVSGQLG